MSWLTIYLGFYSLRKLNLYVINLMVTYLDDRFHAMFNRLRITGNKTLRLNPSVSRQGYMSRDISLAGTI